jgi:hypothetical protein
MAVAVSTPREEGFRSIANLLDGTVVASGFGSAAIGALQDAFQKQAAAGAGNNMDDWLEILEEARLPVPARLARQSRRHRDRTAPPGGFCHEALPGAECRIEP